MGFLVPIWHTLLLIFFLWDMVHACLGHLFYGSFTQHFSCRLREERHQRISKYKARLALLLPPIDQHIKNESAPANWKRWNQWLSAHNWHALRVYDQCCLRLRVLSSCLDQICKALLDKCHIYTSKWAAYL